MTGADAGRGLVAQNAINRSVNRNTDNSTFSVDDPMGTGIPPQLQAQPGDRPTAYDRIANKTGNVINRISGIDNDSIVAPAGLAPPATTPSSTGPAPVVPPAMTGAGAGRGLVPPTAPPQVSDTAGAGRGLAPPAAPVTDNFSPMPQEDQTLNFIRKREAFSPDAYWDVNHHRAGFGSDTVTNPDGTVVPVTSDTHVTIDDANRDLNRRSNISSNQIQQAVGQDAWNGLAPNARTALTSLTYNYGRLPNSVAAAVKTGDPTTIANAVEALKGDNNGANFDRRLEEASMIDPTRQYTPQRSFGDQYAVARHALGPQGLAGGSQAAPASSDGSFLGGLGSAVSGAASDTGNWYKNNQDWITPLLTGIGTMAASPSRYLGSAILQGIGGGAQSYQNVQNQMQQRAALEPVIAQRNVGAVNSLLSGYQTYNAQMPPDKNISLSDYAKLTGYKGALPSGSAPGTATGGLPQLLDQYHRNATTNYNGTVIGAQNDPAFLRQLQDALAPVNQSGTTLGNTYDQITKRLADIKAQGNMTYDERRQLVPIPSMIEAETQSAGIAQTAKNYETELSAAPKAINSAQGTKLMVGNMADAYKNFQAGPGAPALAQINGLIDTVNGNFGTKLPKPAAGADPTAYYSALKDASQTVATQFAGVPGMSNAPRAGTELFMAGTPRPEIVPGAVHKILAQMSAQTELAQRWYSGLQDPEFRQKYGNINNYQQQFVKNPENNLSVIQKQEFDKIGPLKGEEQQFKQGDKIVTGVYDGKNWGPKE